MKTVEQAFYDLHAIKAAVRDYANLFTHAWVFDSNSQSSALSIDRFELLAGFGVLQDHSAELTNCFSGAESRTRWKFVCIPYGDPLSDPFKCTIVEPEIVFCIHKGENVLRIINNGAEPTRFDHLIRAFNSPSPESPAHESEFAGFMAETDREHYKTTVESIRDDIRHGKYYEINYCIGFNTRIRDLDLNRYAERLNAATSAPFSAYVRLDNKILLCSSPERFICMYEGRLYSQPIKGTNKRLEGKRNDEQLLILKSSEKERAENVMIVDLVRNDMAKVCKPGSVRVDELCGAYAYRSVNHLVSTVSGELRPGIALRQIFEALFPMGSMTGAPKHEVMKHILKYEDAPRDIYSGTLGYIDPTGNFDFNVIIRTLVYDSNNMELSYRVGSAITYGSVPDAEYEECLLKGSRMNALFGPQA